MQFWPPNSYRRTKMATEPTLVAQSQRRSFQLSLDWWAVITALVLAALVLLSVIPNVPW
jgi:hypothetical protein